MKKLDKKKEALLQTMPLLTETVRGTVLKRLITCGNDSCRCARGKKHVVWYLSSTHPSGKTEQISLHKEQVAAVKNMVNNYNDIKKILEQVSAINRDSIRLQREQFKQDERQRGKS